MVRPASEGLAEMSGYAPSSLDVDRPIGALILSLIGGLIILVVGIYVGSVLGTFARATGGAAHGLLGLASGLGWLSAFFGLLIIVLGVVVYAQPERHLGGGIGILVLSLLSLVGSGGLFIGLILGVVGGILAIIFVPTEDAEYLAGPPVGWTAARPLPGPGAAVRCPNCGASALAGALRCPMCETPLAGPARA